jgi:hypothetical protein
MSAGTIWAVGFRVIFFFFYDLFVLRTSVFKNTSAPAPSSRFSGEAAQDALFNMSAIFEDLTLHPTCFQIDSSTKSRAISISRDSWCLLVPCMVMSGMSIRVHLPGSGAIFQSTCMSLIPRGIF